MDKDQVANLLIDAGFTLQRHGFFESLFVRRGAMLNLGFLPYHSRCYVKSSIPLLPISTEKRFVDPELIESYLALANEAEENQFNFPPVDSAKGIRKLIAKSINVK